MATAASASTERTPKRASGGVAGFRSSPFIRLVPSGLLVLAAVLDVGAALLVSAERCAARADGEAEDRHDDHVRDGVPERREASATRLRRISPRWRNALGACGVWCG